MRKILLSIMFLGLSAYAADDKMPPEQVRLFVGNQTISPTEVNTELTNNGLHNYSNIANYGVEASYMFVPRLNLGLRAQGKWQKVTETASTPANPQNPYYSSIQQSAVLGVLRIDVATTDVVRVDIFGAAGGTNTTMDIRTAAGDSNYARPQNSVISAAGGSVSVGYGGIFFMVEVGKEWNKVSSLTKTGASSPNVNSIDLSGSYVNIGLLFNGLPKWIHQK